MSDPDDEQGDVLWQNPVRIQSDAVNRRLARIVRHKVTDATCSGPVAAVRSDEIHVELFGRDARGRSRWETASDFESVAVLKAALATAHQVLDAHQADERRRRDRMIEELPRRRVVTAVRPEDRADWTDPVAPAPWLVQPASEPDAPLPAPEPLAPRCLKPQEDSPFGCTLPPGHAGKCDPDIPF